MDKDNQYIKSMEFCQAIIKRMSDNSFRLKQWFFLAVMAMFTVFSKIIFSDKLQFHIDNLFLLLPLLIFPFLDAYYLREERRFREIYNDFMRCINNNETKRKPFNMKPTKEQRRQFSIWNAVFSISVVLFYFIIICVLQGLIIYRSSIPWAYMSIVPFLLIVLGLIFKKKTSHQK